MIKRQRGRGRNPGQKPQNNNPNRAYESNGPDLKVRGSAQTVFEKYQQLARDAQSNGDRVLGENYMQHAEHYFRVLRAIQPNFVPRTELMIAGYDEEAEDGEDGQPANGETSESDGEEAQAGNPQGEFQQNRNNRERDGRDRDGRDRDGRDRDGRNRDNRDRDFRDRPQRDFQPNRDFQQNREPREQGDSRNESEEDRFGRRRRRRPDRFNGEGYAQNGTRPDASQIEGSSQEIGQDGGAPREPRPSQPRYEQRPASGDQQDVTGNPYLAPVAFVPNANPEPAGFSNPQEIVSPTDPTQDAPVRERRPRPPRAPRAPRAPREAKASEAGFGEDMPAFLTTSIPVTSE